MVRSGGQPLVASEELPGRKELGLLFRKDKLTNIAVWGVPNSLLPTILEKTGDSLDVPTRETHSPLYVLLCPGSSFCETRESSFPPDFRAFIASSKRD